MKQIAPWLVIVLGILLLLPVFNIILPELFTAIIFPLIILAIGILRVIEVYKK
jgi:protein-S-isoprenylcysteine O-methyltransferase Ste14